MIISHDTRAEWLETRRARVMASEWAAILGWDPRKNAFDVYVDKKTGGIDMDNDVMLLGRSFEDGISRVYAEKTGRQVLDPGDFTIFVHPELSWLGATQDRQTWRAEECLHGNNPSPLELKHAGWMKRREWLDGAPLFVQIQLQAQMFCSDAPWGAYCGIVGGCEIHHGDIDRNDAFIESALPVLEEFRWRLENDRPPPVESHKNLDTVKRLYSTDSGATVTLDESMTDIANEWETEKQTKNDADKARKLLEAKIREAMGENTVGLLDDGTQLIRATTKNGRKTLRRVNQ